MAESEKRTYKQVYKNAIDELMGLKKAKSLAEFYKRKMAETEAGIGAQNFAPDGVRCYVELSPSERFVEEMMKWKKRYEEAFLHYTCQENDVLNKIDRLRYPYSEILRQKYVNGKTFELISVEMSYEYRWLQRLHRKALKIYSEVNKIDHIKPYLAML